MTSTTLLKIRAVTAFVNLDPRDFTLNDDASKNGLAQKMRQCCELHQHVVSLLSSEGYNVQTQRIATNPFGEWLTDSDDPVETSRRLRMIDDLLAENDISFCALGPAQTASEIAWCPKIIAASLRFSCSANVHACDVNSASVAAESILQISRLDGQDYLADGLGNFRFCTTSSCRPFIPFFPAAKSYSNSSHPKHANDIVHDDGTIIPFAIGLENGALVRQLLQECKSIANISTLFSKGMSQALLPLQILCEEASKQVGFGKFLGIDSSLNPSLDDDGSVAEAVEMLDEVQGPFGGPGTLAAAAALTTTIQSLPNIQLVGYCGLMLPLCEDRRLAQFSSDENKANRLSIAQLLNISNVCGVGVDTVPVGGDCSKAKLTSLILDVAAIAGRWDKSLSCRVFPVPGGIAGDYTTFDSPYLCNARILEL